MSTFQAVRPQSCTAHKPHYHGCPFACQAWHRAAHSHPWGGQSSHRAACTECWQHCLCSNDPQNAFLTPCWMHSSSTAVALSAVPPFTPASPFSPCHRWLRGAPVAFPLLFWGQQEECLEIQRDHRCTETVSFSHPPELPCLNPGNHTVPGSSYLLSARFSSLQDYSFFPHPGNAAQFAPRSACWEEW